MADVILSIFEPHGELLIDVVRFMIFSFLSFLVIWAIELWLCRNWRILRRDTEMNIYFSWLLLFTGYGTLVTAFAVLLGTLYREADIRSIYAVPYLILGLLALGLGWYLNRKIAGRVYEEGEE